MLAFWVLLAVVLVVGVVFTAVYMLDKGVKRYESNQE
jgi:hypothetical protein